MLALPGIQQEAFEIAEAVEEEAGHLAGVTEFAFLPASTAALAAGEDANRGAVERRWNLAGVAAQPIHAP
jgi:hypothetical protein